MLSLELSAGCNFFDDSDEIENELGDFVPNLGNCARRNFPPKAKAYVTEALVNIEVIVDKTGLVRQVKPVNVKLLIAENSEQAKSTIPMFARAARESLLNQRCPVYSKDGKAVGYKISLPLIYRIQ